MPIRCSDIEDDGGDAQSPTISAGATATCCSAPGRRRVTSRRSRTHQPTRNGGRPISGRVERAADQLVVAVFVAMHRIRRPSRKANLLDGKGDRRCPHRHEDQYCRSERMVPPPCAMTTPRSVLACNRLGPAHPEERTGYRHQGRRLGGKIVELETGVENSRTTSSALALRRTSTRLRQLPHDISLRGDQATSGLTSSVYGCCFDVRGRDADLRRAEDRRDFAGLAPSTTAAATSPIAPTP